MYEIIILILILGLAIPSLFLGYYRIRELRRKALIYFSFFHLVAFQNNSHERIGSRIKHIAAVNGYKLFCIAENLNAKFDELCQLNFLFEHEDGNSLLTVSINNFEENNEEYFFL
jgi:hypothetical protein